MKPARIALILAAAGLMAACAPFTTTTPQESRSSADYTASGPANDVRAYLYGGKTLLEFKTMPAYLSVTDAAGQAVDVEKVGTYARLPRALDNFSVSMNGQVVTFKAIPKTVVFSGEAFTPINQPTTLQAAPAIEADPGDVNVKALVDLCEAQLREAHALLEAANKNPNTTGRELAEINHRLDEVQSRMELAAAALVKVSFPRASTTFAPPQDLAKVLIAAGQAAQQINVRGKTDAQKAGSLDGKIALGRALAAKKFLVDHGIDAGKISVFSQAEGGFAAPNNTKQGKAYNRRVEIEFVNPRIALLKAQTIAMAN